MIPASIIGELQTLEDILETESDHFRAMAADASRHENERDYAYWTGKAAGVHEAAYSLSELKEKYISENEKELEDEAAERSEKDCMWEDRA